MNRQIEKYRKSLDGIREMTRLPDALFVIDVGYGDIAIKEARKLGIPIIGVVDTNNSPEGLEYIVPGNDDAIRAIQLYARLAAEAVLEGRASAPAPAQSEDEFVELDADGNPVVDADNRVMSMFDGYIFESELPSVPAPEDTPADTD